MLKRNRQQNPMNSRQLKGAAFTFLMLLALLFPSAVWAQATHGDATLVKSFNQRTSIYSPETKVYHIQGNYQMIGNCNLTRAAGTPTAAHQNNNTEMRFVDIDDDANTVNSSSAKLQFSTERGANPECSRIIYAGLYWAGRKGTSSSSDGMTYEIGGGSGSSTNLKSGNSYEGYSLSISKAYRESDKRVTTTYTFTPSNGGSTITFRMRGNLNNDNTVMNSCTLQVRTGSGDWTTVSNVNWTNPTPYNNSSYYKQAELRTPYVISTGNTSITVSTLKTRFRNNGDIPSSVSGNNDYAVVASNTPGKVLQKNIVKFKHEDGTYQEVTANTADILYPSGQYNNIYVAYAEVTDIVREYGEGNYYVADICTHEGSGGGIGYCGGWGMVIIYENSKMKWRDITLFDGYAQINGNNRESWVDIDISGFKSVQVGHVNMTLGMMAAEGDAASYGDYAKIKAVDNEYYFLNHDGQVTSTDYPTDDHTTTYNNFFNGETRNGGLPRNPNYVNNMGVDLLMIPLENANNSIIANEQTTTSFRFGSKQEVYVPFCFVFGCDAYIPDAQAIDAVVESPAAQYDPDLDIWVTHPGDTVSFTVKVRNYDDEDIRDAEVTLPLPATIEFYSLEAEYADGSTGDFYFDPRAGVNGTAHWKIDYLPAGYPDSTWATFKLNCYITENCFVLASKSEDCLLELIVNGTLSGTSVINGVYFEHPFIQGFQESGVCQGSSISEDLRVVIERDEYIREHCDCSADPNVFDNTCFQSRDLFFCNPNSDTIPFTQVSQYYPIGTRFYLASDQTVEYTVNTGFPPSSQNKEIIAIPPAIGHCETSVYVKTSVGTADVDNPTAPVSPIGYCLNETAAPLSEAFTLPTTTYHPYIVFYKEDPGSDLVNPTIPAYYDIVPNTDAIGTTTYYAVQYLSDEGFECYHSELMTVTITVSSPLTISSSLESPTCAGTPITFTPSVSGGTYDIPSTIASYISLSGSVATLQSDAPAGTYTFTYTAPDGIGAEGCPESLTQTITHTVYAASEGGSILPGNITICNGSDIPELALTEYTGHVEKWEYRYNSSTSGGSWGSWTTIPNNTWRITQADIAELSTGRYQFRASVKSGECDAVNSSTITVTVSNNSAPSALSLPSPVFACVGSPYVLGENNSSYRWYASETGGTADGSLRTGTMGEAWVQAYVSQTTTSGGVTCESQRVMVEARPYFDAGTISSTGEVKCSGDTYNTIGSVDNAVPTTGATGNITYQWFVSVNGGTPTAISSSNSATFNPTSYMSGKADGTYVFTRKASFSNSTVTCDAIQSEGSYTIIKGNPDATIAAPESTVLCGDGSITLTLQTGFSSQNSYQWYKDGAALSGKTSASLVVTQPGGYTVKVTHKASGCTAISTVVVITQDETSPVVPSNRNTHITGCSLSTVPAAYTTIAALESGFGVNITDDNTADADLTLTYEDVTVSSDCPFVVERTYTITDECGNASSFIETITIENTTTPVITIDSQSNPEGACITTSVTAPTFTVMDACDNDAEADVEVEAVITSGCSKSQTWTATYTSVCGVSADEKVVTYTWTEDNTAPTIDAIVALNATPAGNCQYEIPDLEEVTLEAVSDGCSTVTFTSQSPAAGAEYAQTSSVQNIPVTVTVTDGCGNEATKTVVVTIPAKLTANVASTTNIDCYDASTGAIELTVSGGTPAYTYLWSNGETSEDLSSVLAGTYAVTVTDDNGCTANVNATLTQPASDISITLTPTNVLCNGKETGAITATVTGGTPDYDYEWGTGATTATVSGLSAGEYTLTVTDNKGCEKTASVTITEPATAVNITTINKTNVLCKDAANGTAEVVAEGGTLAAGHTYSYIWSNNETTASVSGLAPGTYTVTVTDDNECEATGEVKITEPTALTLTTEESNVSCAGSSNGSVNVSVSGGTSPYTYAWSGDATSSEEDLEDLGGGTYTLIVTDHNGCTVTETIEIEEPDVLSLGLSPVSETCDGGDGKITAAATGGTQFDLGGENPYYLYSWYRKTSATDSVLIASNVTQIDTLSAGNFTVVVKDANGCEAQASVTLELDNPLAINTTLSANPTICSGGSFSFAPEDGEDGSVPDGTLYSWEAPVVENVSNTHAGVNQSTIHDEGIVYTGTASSVDIPYNVVATYGEICQNSTTVTVTVSATVNGNMTIALTNDTVCPNVGTKTLTATLGNLTNNYDITWTFNGSETTQSRNQSETTPTLNVTIPSDNCNVVYPYTVSVEDSLHCKNSKTGNIVVRIPDWNISEANGSKTVACPSAAVPPTLPTVTDGCGNTLTPQSIGFDPETDDPVTCSGTVEYKYRYTACDNSYKDWTYTYIIKDSIAPVLADCSDLDEELTSDECTFIVPDFEDDVMDLASDNCAIVEYVQSPEADAEITETTTVTVYVKDACGNESAHRTITVTVPAPVQLAEVTAEHNDVMCKNGATGSFKVSATQGKSPYTYTLGTTSNSTGEFSGLEDGTYTVTVTDANGCTNTVDVTITEPEQELTASVPAPAAICYGNESTISVTAQGGTGNYTYSWSDGTNTVGSTSSITVSPTETTTYSVTVTDENGCTASDSKTLTVYSLPIVELDGVSDLCPTIGSTDLTANITTTSAAPYKYEWTGMTVTPATTSGSTATSNTVSATIPTDCGEDYTVTVTLTDNNGCTATADAAVSVLEPATPTIELADGTADSKDLGCNPTAAQIPTLTAASFVVTDECNASAAVELDEGEEEVDGCTHSKTWTASYTNGCIDEPVTKAVTYTWTETTEPVITPGDALAASGAAMECNWDYANEGPTATDFELTSGDCATDPVVTVTSKITGDCQKTGVWTATYENQCHQKDTVKITYTWTADEEDPDVTGTLDDINVAGCDETAVPAAATTVAALKEMGVEISDNCSSTFTVSSEDADASGTCVKTVVRTYTVTDACGNSSTATQNIIITPADFISNMPEPGEKTVSCAASVGTPATPTVEDACGNVITDIELKSKTDNPSCEGTVVYTYTYTDCAGHSHDWTYTYTIDLPIVEMPADGRDTVPCEIDAQHTPTPPELTDACGRALQVAQVGDPVSTVGTNGRGTVTYTFEYTDCTGQDYDYEWNYVYYVIPDAFTPRANGSSSVSCVSTAASTTPTLPDITVCGESVNLTLVSKVDSTENGCGKYIYTYKYTVNGVEYTWKYTYNVSPADFASLMPESTGSTVSCEDEAVAPGAPALNNDCGTAVTISEPAVGGTYTDCEGTITYTYTYSDCAGHSHDYVYTYNIVHEAPAEVGGPVDTASTVECVSAATAPTVFPVVKDACGNVLEPNSTVVEGGTYTNCEGTKTYTYTYEDCAGKQFVWTYTYTIKHTTAPTEVGGPVAAASTVGCESAAIAPTTLPVVKDVCGNVLDAPEPEVDGTYTDCEGTKTYTYTYEDCAGKQFVWTYTYTIAHSTAPAEVGGPVATRDTVECESAAAAPATLPVVKDVCGNVLDVPEPVVATDIHGCEGTKTYTYTYEDCAGEQFVWTYTHAILRETEPAEVGGPVATTSTVQCADDVDAPTTMPVVKDVCGATLTNPSLVITNNVDGCEGTIDYTYTYTDCAGLMYKWTYTYVIEDTTKPVVTVVDDEVAATPAGVCGYTVPNLSSNIEASDNCTAASSLTITQNPTAGTAITATSDVTVSVTDACGNTTSKTISVTVPDDLALTEDEDAHADITCYGGNDGSITVNTATGGTAPYTYAIDGGTASSTKTFGGLEAGDYTITVYDANGCSTDLTVTLSQPDELDLTLNMTKETCEGHDGKIEAEVTGGTAPYSYAWSNGHNASSCDTLTSLVNGGVYTITVTDAHSCTVTETATVELDNPLTLASFNLGPFCSGNEFNYIPVDGVDGYLPAGTTYFWPLPTSTVTEVTGLAASDGEETSIHGEIYNNGTEPAVISYLVTPRYGICVGTETGSTVTVNSQLNPPVTVNMLNDTTVCPNGDDFTLTAIFVGVNSVHNVVWRSGGSEGPVIRQQNDVAASTTTDNITVQIPNTPCDTTYIYHVTYEDQSGCEASDALTMYVKIADWSIETLPGSETVSCISAAVEPATKPVVTDGCEQTTTRILYSVVDVPNPIVCEGTRTYTYRYTACDGSHKDWTYTYTIERQPFEISAADGKDTVACPADVVDPHTLSPSVMPTVTDNCGNDISDAYELTTTPTAVDCEGTMTYVYTYTDCEGNTDTWNFVYTIERKPFEITADAGSATVTCPASAVAPHTLSPGVMPTVTDACGNDISDAYELTTTPATVTCEGTMTYVYTYTDCEGNTDTWDFVYTIEREPFEVTAADGKDTVACPTDVVAPHTLSPSVMPTVTDNCGNDISDEYELTTTPTTVDCEGTMTYIYTYTDCEGNIDTWNFVYTIERKPFEITADAGSKVVACPDNAVAPHTLTPSVMPTVTDACDNDISDEYELTTTPTAVDCEGTMTYVYTYTDCEGNTDTWDFVYTVEREDFTMPADVRDTVACISEVGEPELPVVKDSCGNVLIPIDTVVSGNPECEGSVTYTYTYKDCEENSHTWTYTYVIEYEDFEMPENDGNTVACIAQAVLPTPPTVTDNCGNTLTPTEPTNYVVTTYDGCEGNVTYTFTYTDCEGNTHDWVYTYTIERNDFTMPANTGSTVACIADAKKAGETGSAITLPTVTDDCGNTLTPIEPTDYVVTTYNGCEGNVTYTYVYTDCEGNTHDWVYTYRIEVEDFTMPADKDTTVDCVSKLHEPTLPVVTDNCGNVLEPYISHVTDIPSCNGDVKYIYTYKDCENNSHNWTYTYHIVRTGNPVVNATGFDVSTDVDCIDLAVELSDSQIPTATSSCGEELNGVLTNTVDDFPVSDCKGTRTLTYTYTDCAGNDTTWDFVYNVEDNVAPTFTAPSDFTISRNADCTYSVDTTLTHSVPTDLEDNCSAVADLDVAFSDVTVTTAGECPSNLTITRTWTVTDACGNSTSHDQTITIEDNTAPVVTGALAALNIEGCSITDKPEAYTTVAQLEANGIAVSDGCSADEDLEVSYEDGAASATCPYTFTRIYKITDECGNTASTPQIIRIRNTAVPTITTAQTNINLGCNPITITAPVESQYTVYDVCDEDAVVTLVEGEEQIINCVHSKVWTGTYTNACGTSAVPASITVTWVETEAPEIVLSPESTLAASGTDMGCNWDYANDGPKASDFVLTSGDCASAPAVTITSGITGDCQKSGVWTINYENQCHQTDTVKIDYTWTDDSAAPEIGEIAEQTATVNGSCEYVMPDLEDVVMTAITESCGEATFVSQSVTAGTSYTQTEAAQNIAVAVTVKDACDNEATTTVNVVVPAKPSISVAPADVTCANNDGTVVVTATGGTAPYTYEYAKRYDNTWSTVNNTNTLTGLDTATYTVTMTDANGCEASEEFVIDVDDDWDVTITPITDEVCSGSSFAIIPSSTAAGITHYSWSAPTQSVAGAVTGVTASDSNETTIHGEDLVNTTDAPVTLTYTVTPTYGICEGTPQDVQITVLPTGTAVPTISVDSLTVCPNEGALTLTAAFSDALTDGTVTWNFNNGTDAVHTNVNGTTDTYTVTVPSTGCDNVYGYTVEYEDGEGCTTTVSGTVTVAVADDITLSTTTPTAGTVQCASAATADAITLPTATDACGQDIDEGSWTLITVPAEVSCNGTMAYTFRITDCAGHTKDWTYTYTIERTDVPTEVDGPVDVSDDVECLSEAVAPTLPVVKDVCGNTLNASAPVVTDNITGCIGTRTYQYTYKDCANLEYVWTFTYNITGPATAPVVDAMLLGNSATVSCVNDASPLIISPFAVSQCGDMLPGVIVNTTDNPENLECGMAGTRTYTYRYTDCNGNYTDWDFTYIIEPAFEMPDDDGTTVACASEIVAPELPEVHDYCGELLTPAGPAVSETPDCNGDVTYTYTYTDCKGDTHDWVYTYTIEAEAPTLAVEGTWPADLTGYEICQQLASGFPSIDDVKALYTTACGELSVDFEYSFDEGCEWTVTRIYTIDNGCASTTNTFSISGTNQDDMWIENSYATSVAPVVSNCVYSYPDLRENIRELVRESCEPETDLAITQTPAPGTVIAQISAEQQLPVTVTVIDNCGYTVSTENIKVVVPAAMSLTITSAVSNCVDAADGVISYTVAGGSAEYTATLSGAASASQTHTVADSYYFGNLADGAYTVTIVDANGCEVSADATVLQNVNTLTIRANSHTWTFDGTAHTDDGYTVTIGSESHNGTSGSDVTLNNGDVLNVTISGSITAVGSEPNVVATGYTITRYGDDVTCQYNIATIDGQLNVVSDDELTLICENQTKEYDGTALSYTSTASVAGAAIEYSTDGTSWSDEAPSITNVSESPMTVYVRATKEGFDPAECQYTLTITPKPIVITITDNKEYDGTELTTEYDDPSVTVDGLVPGDELTGGSFTTTDDNAGDYNNGDSTSTITDPFETTNGIDNYDVTYVVEQTIDKRDITITADSDSKEYDGTPLTDDGYGITDGTLATGDVLTSVDVDGSQTEVGTSGNTPSNAVIINGGEDVTPNYNIIYEDGTLTVNDNPAEIVISSESNSWIYDGETHTEPVYTVSYDGTTIAPDEGSDGLVFTLPTGDKITITPTGEITNKDTVDNTFTYTLENADQYSDVTVDYGDLAVICRPVTITAATSSYFYDGNVHTNPAYTVVGLVGADEIVPTVTGSIQYVDQSPAANIVGEYVFTGVDEDNYCITKVDGQLTMACSDVELAITADSQEWIYDGEDHTQNSYTLSIDGATAISVPVSAAGVYTFSNGDVLTVTITGTVHNATTAAVANDIVSYTIFHDGEDVSDCYDIIPTDGELTVSKRPITITAGSAEKLYDGTALTEDSYTSTGTLADGETIEAVTVTGSQTDIGSSANVPSDAVILNGDGDTVTGNYDITYENGLLEITGDATPIVITSGDCHITYDAQDHTCEEYTVTYGGDTLDECGTCTPAPGTHEYIIPTTGDTITIFDPDTLHNVDTIPNTFDYTITNEDNYIDVDTTVGTFSVDKRPIVIVAGDSTKVYDGQPLTDYEYTVGGDSLVPGEDITHLDITGSITEVGTTPNVPSDVVIMNGADTVTNNYDITYVDGELEVTKDTNDIVITSGDCHITYDAADHTCEEYTVTYGGSDVPECTSPDCTHEPGEHIYILPTGDTITVTPHDTLHNVDTIPNQFDYTVTNIDNYETVDTTEGVFSVDKLPITITAESAEKDYDGTPLTKDEWTLDATTPLAMGDNIDTVVVTGSQTEAGNSPNVPSDAVIIDGDGNDVTGNYDITYANGTLTVYSEFDIINIEVTDVTCFDAADGSAVISVTGGKPLTPLAYNYEVTGPDSYSASGSTNSPLTLSGLADGIYIISFTDALDSVASATFTINEPAALSAEITLPADRCPNQGSYAVSVTATGGNGTYHFVWSGDAADVDADATTVAQTLTNDCGNSYSVTVTVTDAKGCTVTVDSILKVVDTIKPTFKAPKDTTICRASDGTISAPTTTTGELADVADNCDAAPTVSWTDLDTTGTDLEIRIIHRQWTVSDACGNDSVKVQNISILPSVAVPGAIELTCAPDTTLELCYGFADTLMHLTAPTVVSHTGATYTVISDPADGYRFPVGTTTVTWYITDDNVCGNFVTCMQNVTITLPSCGEPTDSARINGYAYSSVRIGYQCWTGENMRHTYYADSSAVDVNGYTNYANDPANDEKFGKLYTWYAALGLSEGDDVTEVPAHTQGICPDGWGIPTEEEYILMLENSGSMVQAKEASTLYWYPGLEGQLPGSGFNARGGGWYNSATASFESLFVGARFWTSTQVGPSNSVERIAVDFGVCSSEEYVALKKASGASVRCIKLCE